MASPIVKRVLDRHEGEKSLRILESNFTPNNAKLWDIAKTLAEKKFDVYSTEAHGWAYKWYEKKGGIFKELNEATRVPSEMGNVYRVLYSWRGKTFMMKMFFPTIFLNSLILTFCPYKFTGITIFVFLDIFFLTEKFSKLYI